MNDNASNIEVLDAYRPHRVQEVICLGCGHRYISCHIATTCLKDLHCPTCDKVGMIIGTGCEAILTGGKND